MTVYHGSPSDRFFRPVELGSTPRNYRKLQARRLLIGGANLLFAALLILAGFWLWRKTQEDVRFAVQQIEISGLVHAPPAEIEALTEGYGGANLFRLDLDQLRADLRRHPWVESVTVEKKLPDTLEIVVVERTPAALVLVEEGLRYVDRHGVSFAGLSPRVGNPDLPLISETRASEVAAAVEFLGALKQSAPELYSRVSQISATPSSGFAVWDRELATVVRMGEDGAEKWTALHQIARADGWRRGTLEYADLRFRGRIVVKPREQSVIATRSGASQ